MLFHILIYILAFTGIWLGAGIAIHAVEKLAKGLKLSSFFVSFIILGFFTSVSEFSVGINSVITNDAEIFVGNLIGASIVLLIMVVPLLAITGSKVKINEELRGSSLIFSLLVIAAPVLLALDGIVDLMDSFIAIILFVILAFVFKSKNLIAKNALKKQPITASKIHKHLFSVVMGVAVIFVASHFVVEETLYFSQLMGVPPFLISLLVISIGTNVPELSFVLRSAFMSNNQVAFGDYIGSAAVNTFLFGVLTLINGKQILMTNSYLISLIFMIIGLILFYFFARSKNTITRKEGFILLSLYFLFIITEFITHIH